MDCVGTPLASTLDAATSIEASDVCEPRPIREGHGLAKGPKLRRDKNRNPSPGTQVRGGPHSRERQERDKVPAELAKKARNASLPVVTPGNIERKKANRQV